MIKRWHSIGWPVQIRVEQSLYLPSQFSAEQKSVARPRNFLTKPDHFPLSTFIRTGWTAQSKVEHAIDLKFAG